MPNTLLRKYSFSQADYIKSKMWWWQARNCKGLCHGLSLVYLSQPADDFIKFISYVNSSQGFAVIQELQSTERTIIQMGAAGRPLLLNATQGFMRKSGKRRERHFFKEIKSASTATLFIMSTLLGSANRWYYMAMQGPDWAHATAIVTQTGAYRFFDPNTGEVAFNSLEALARHVNETINTDYKDLDWIALDCFRPD